MNYIKTFDPSILLGDRLELTLYGMFVEAYRKNSSDYEFESELYRKFIAAFPGERGIHSPEIFSKLIDSVVANGFDSQQPVYANPHEYSLVEGAHRCSIAIQLGLTSIPYNLRFRDDRVKEIRFREILGDQVYELLLKKQKEYIERLSPEKALLCKIRVHMRQNQGSFQAAFSSETKISALRTYQGYEKYGITGKRPSQQRFEIYELGKFLNPEMSLLEIGCNVGFFNQTVAEHIKYSDAIDVDKNYIYVANLLKKYRGSENCNYYVSPINTFQPAQAYDLIISMAVHGWVGISFPDYISILFKNLKKDGLIMFESHEIDSEKDWKFKRKLLSKLFDVVKFGLIDDIDDSMYESEMREFLILRKSKELHNIDINESINALWKSITETSEYETYVKELDNLRALATKEEKKSIVRRLYHRFKKVFF